MSSDRASIRFDNNRLQINTLCGKMQSLLMLRHVVRTFAAGLCADKVLNRQYGGYTVAPQMIGL
jgi:hypothetical protein